MAWVMTASVTLIQTIFYVNNVSRYLDIIMIYDLFYRMKAAKIQEVIKEIMNQILISKAINSVCRVQSHSNNKTW